MEQNRLIFLGDIHGAFKYLKEEIEYRNFIHTTIIQVGDFGIGFNTYQNDSKQLDLLNQFLIERNNILYVIRGNHDNPAYFTGEYLYSNLKLLPDYTILNINDNRILLIGGGISIDRKPRIQRNLDNFITGRPYECYWENEVISLTKKQLEFLKTIEDIDMLITHTAPSWCYPDNKHGYPRIVSGYFPYDKNLEKDLIKERKQMNKIFNILLEKNDIKHHFYGHFHSSNITINKNCTHHLLNINEFYEI
jgi:UDP-2,3-diacylglucosamine pyrophosphatase LpxH